MHFPIHALTLRSTWLKAHLFLALTAGFLFALLGLTGSLSVYQEELDELLNPRLTLDEPNGEYLPLDKIMAQVKAAHPGRQGEWVLEMPRTAYGMMTAWHENPYETYGEGYAPLMVSVNPYTGKAVANRFYGHTFTTWIDGLHRELQMGLFGTRMVGLLGLGLAFSIISGLFLWWPGFKGLMGIFKIRSREGLRRLFLDLHGIIGLCSAFILLVLALTGFHLAYPKLLENLAGASGMGHDDDGPAIRSTAVPNDRPVSLAEAVLIARGPFPHASVRRIIIPATETGTYRVNLRRPGEVNIRHPVTMVWIDRWSGQIRNVRNPNLLTGGQAFVSSLWPMHTGEAYGETGRLLWFFTGLTPMLLYATGLTQWLIKRGSLNDREVDFSALRPFWIRGLSALQRFAMLASRYLSLALGWGLKQTGFFYAWIRRWNELK